MPGNYPGFGLIEIVIAIALFAVLGSLVVPNYLRQQAGYEQKKFMTGLNALMSEVWQRALTSGKIEKVKFDFNARIITVEQQADTKDKDGKSEFEPITLHYAQNKLSWADTLVFQNFFINREDEFATRGPHGTINDAWFFVMPSGMAQEVIINLVDTKQAGPDQEGKEYGLVLNPFTLQYKVYDEFQYPGA